MAAGSDQGWQSRMAPLMAGAVVVTAVFFAVVLLVRFGSIEATLRDPAGRYGPMTCVAGYVWRATTLGDAVCVVPQRRDQAAADNAAAAARRAQP